MGKKKELLIDALKSKYSAEMKECKATLHIYTSESVGVGEHPQITEELDKLLERYADAEGKLQVLKNLENEL
jgi:hypothetical protein